MADCTAVIACAYAPAYCLTSACNISTSIALMIARYTLSQCDLMNARGTFCNFAQAMNTHELVGTCFQYKDRILHHGTVAGFDGTKLELEVRTPDESCLNEDDTYKDMSDKVKTWQVKPDDFKICAGLSTDFSAGLGRTQTIIIIDDDEGKFNDDVTVTTNGGAKDGLLERYTNNGTQCDVTLDDGTTWNGPVEAVKFKSKIGRPSKKQKTSNDGCVSQHHLPNLLSQIFPV